MWHYTLHHTTHTATLHPTPLHTPPHYTTTRTTHYTNACGVSGEQSQLYTERSPRSNNYTHSQRVCNAYQPTDVHRRLHVQCTHGTGHTTYGVAICGVAYMSNLGQTIYIVFYLLAKK